MLVYDKAYMDLRSKYLVPLAKYSVSYSHLRNTNIKRTIVEKTTSVDVISDREYIFHFDEDYLLKALLGDVELFYIRKIIQNDDTICGTGVGVSANWNIVTHYYNAFFASSLMLRLCHRGNIYLDNDLKRNLEKMISMVTGTVIKLDSNQYYEVYERQGQYVLKLTKAEDNTHELVWRKLDSLIDDMLLLARKKSDEYLILSAIRQINRYLGNTFPSQLRNRVNYQTIYGLNCIDKKIFPINPNIAWVDYLLDCNMTDNDNQIACYMYAYTKYIEYFCSNFIAEYYEIRGNENGILKKINSSRLTKMRMEKQRYVF